MAANEKRTIEIPLSIDLERKIRSNEETPRDQADKFTVTCDLSKLSADELMEYAYAAMVISFQSKLRSKTPPKAEEDGSYKWTVEPRGTRTAVDPAKVSENAAKLLNKMDDSAKKELLYKTLISIDKSPAEATAISGFAPKAEEKK